MSEPTTQRAGAKAVFSTYLKHALKYPWAITAVIVGVIAIQAGELAAPLYLRKFFNALVQNQPSAETTNILLSVLSILILFWTVRWVGNRLEHFTNIFFESHVMADLYRSTFTYLIGHSHNFFVSRFAGSLTHKVNKFVRSFETMFDVIVLQFFPTALFILSASVILFIHNKLLGMMLGGWSILFASFLFYMAHLRQPLRIKRSEAETAGTAALADAISNQMAISLFAGRGHESKMFGATVERWRKATVKSWFSDALVWSGLGLFMIGIQTTLLYGAIVFWSRGMLTIGDFVLMQAYLLTTFDRLIHMNIEIRRFHDAFADASEMVEILRTPHEIADAPHAKPLKVEYGEIVFDDLNFGFSPERPILVNFNLHVPPQQKVALVGPSGAGKSTITKLLLRMFDIQRGQILIDGQNIAKVTQESLRENIAFVPQEPVLFHRTLMDNIRYGRRDATDQEVMEAAHKAHCHEFISALPEGYYTLVGERGVKLSGGERQRIAIARAILKNAPILILDEATSSLDSESESLIQDALENLMLGKTVVVIAHRLSTIMKMDRIVVMEGGEIVAEGTHLELIRQRGLYQKLWSIQAGGFLGDGDKPAEEVEEEIEAEELAEDREEK